MAGEQHCGTVAVAPATTSVPPYIICAGVPSVSRIVVVHKQAVLDPVSEALLWKDCLNFLVDNVEQVQKTQSEGDGRGEC